VEDIKKQLLGRKILLINAKDVLENVEISELKRCMYVRIKGVFKRKWRFNGSFW
jgi:hypothetical protein